MIDTRLDRSEHFDSLVSLLRYRAVEHGAERAYTLVEDDRTESVVTYAALDRQARIIAAHLQERGAAGERALLLFQPGAEYIIAFLGCLYAGVVAVPVYPPNPARLARTLPRLQAIVANAEARFALTSAEILGYAEPIFEVAGDLGALTWIATDILDPAAADTWHTPATGSERTAFLQYTSGSTGTPKGVILTHGNLLANLAAIKAAFALTTADVGVSWLPPYHDMGLIGGILQPIYCGVPCVLLSPVDFLQRPIRWLRAIARHRGTVSGGPNFAYELCIRKISAEQRAELDLSSWRVAFNGAEPVRAAVLEKFSAAFAVSGFRAEAMYPCYGLAETTLLASGGDPYTAPPCLSVRADELTAHRVVRVAHDTPGSIKLVSCGYAPAEHALAIVDTESHRRCPEDVVGEIWLSGPSIAQGYWACTEESSATFCARITDEVSRPYLRTGDLGFVHEGLLYVTGRIKDLIIIDGRNHYPQDIELTIEQSHPAIRAGCSAAFAVEVADQERLVVTAEVERDAWKTLMAGGAQALEALRTTVRQAVAESHDLRLYDLVLLKNSTIPKTSSGKIQRHACRMGYLQGALERVEEEK